MAVGPAKVGAKNTADKILINMRTVDLRSDCIFKMLPVNSVFRQQAQAVKKAFEEDTIS